MLIQQRQPVLLQEIKEIDTKLTAEAYLVLGQLAMASYALMGSQLLLRLSLL